VHTAQYSLDIVIAPRETKRDSRSTYSTRTPPYSTRNPPYSARTPLYSTVLHKFFGVDGVSLFPPCVTLNEHYKGILFGFLSGLSRLIADSSVVLDPTDPSTYRDLFSGLASSITKRSEELQQVTNEQDVKKLIAQDSANTNQQLAKINETLEQLMESKDSLQARIEDTDERVFKQQKLTALQRKAFIKEREAHKKQLATYECSIYLLQRQQEALVIRQNTMNFIKGITNLIMFYRTIENRLQALFQSVLAAQGGYLKTEITSVYSKAATIPFGKYNYQYIGLSQYISKVILSSL
jgi:hypothetical protein